MEEGEGCGGGGPVRDLFKLPEEGDAGEEDVDVVIDPVIAFHECVSAFVTIEAVLDLKAGNDEVDQVEQQKEGQIVIGFAADRQFALRDQAFV